MFTGLITDVGVIEEVRDTDAGREFRIRSGYQGLDVGESVACDGVCLTVLEQEAARFRVAAMTATLARTTLGRWEPHRRLNLERALRADDRFGGHIVQGHVDAVGLVAAWTAQEDSMLLDVDLPMEFAPLVVPRGSIAIDGVSLTVAEVSTTDTGVRVRVALIRHTLASTALADRLVAHPVNVEADVIGKYVARLVKPYTP
jgi:riboflavin synthase